MEEIDLKEEDYVEFFNWLLDREVKLDKELDFILCSTFSNPYVYYPEEIKRFIETKPMQRLMKIEQLGTSILNNTDAYHTRYLHSLGTYNNAVLFFMNQYKNKNWREKVEAEGKKIEVLANIMEALRHDDGHNILSHGLEKLIDKKVGSHEVLGARFKTEYPETISAINAIHPELLEAMKRVSSEDYDLITLREGNIDFDRLDFVSRDMLYLGMDEKRGIINKLLTSSKIERVEKDGKPVDIQVYDYDALPYIQEFLNQRAYMYEKIICSNERQALDNLEQELCKMILKSDIDEGKDLREYLKHCSQNTAKSIDLDRFLDWDDIRYYNSLFQIAMQNKDENLRDLAIACLPNIESLCNIALGILDTKNTKPEDFAERDVEFLKNVRAVMKKEHPLHNVLIEGTTQKAVITLNSNTAEEFKEVLASLRKQGVSEEELKLINTWDNKIKKYNSNETIYVRGKDGKIYPLEQHPDLSIDLSPINMCGSALMQNKLRSAGVPEEKIDLMKAEFERFNLAHPIDDSRKYAQRMRPFKIESEPKIFDYTPRKNEGENR